MSSFVKRHSPFYCCIWVVCLLDRITNDFWRLVAENGRQEPNHFVAIFDVLYCVVPFQRLLGGYR